MESETGFLLAADAVLGLHAIFVIFVVFGLALILVGGQLSWLWVRNPWFRLAHLTAIAVVVVQSWVDAICPLTSIEMALRAKAGGTVYAGSFIAHWIQRILFYDAPSWVFIAIYSLFGAAVAASWIWIQPRPFGFYKQPKT